MASLQSKTHSNFGPINLIADAKSAINKLSLAEDGKAIKYFVEFNKYKSRTRVNDWSYYVLIMNQMPMCILHHIAECIPLHSNYVILQSFILSIDAQYWNFKEMESNRKKASGSNHNSGGSSGKTSGSSSNKNSGNNSNNNNSGGSNNNNNSGSKSNNNSNQNNNSGKNNTGKKNNSSNTEDLSSKLGPDSKLTSEEKQRRIDKGLCLICGERGHMAKECPKSKNANTSTKPKGGAAKGRP